MFLEINGIMYNAKYISSMIKEESEEKNGEYRIIYNMVNGQKMVEDFNTEEKQEEKYDEAKEAGVVDAYTKDEADVIIKRLQDEIDAIEAQSDVVDVVGTYADLQSYDTTKLHENDIVKVLVDETRDNKISYYRWSHDAWAFIGALGPYYTVTEVNNLLLNKQNVIQFSTMPTASAENLGTIVQFTGLTDTYTNGYFYKCVSDGGNPATYSWENINTQAGPVIDTKVYVFTTPFTAVYTQSLSADDIVTLNKAIDSYRANENFILFAKKMYFKINESTSTYSYNVPGVISGSGKNITITFYRNVQEANTSVPFNFSSSAIIRTITLSNVATPAAVSSASLSSQGALTSGDNIITIGNTVSYNVTGDYNPAHKKYVDDSIQNVYAACGLSAYSSSSTYAVGDYVYKDNVVYVCNTAIGIAEDWTAVHWTLSNLEEYLQATLVGVALGGSY